MQVVAQAVINPENIEVTLEDVGGLGEIIADITRNVITPMQHPELYRSSLLRQKRGVLLYGPPGTGEWARVGCLVATGVCVMHSVGGRCSAGMGKSVWVAGTGWCCLLLPADLLCCPLAHPLTCRPLTCLQARPCLPRRWPASAAPASSCSRAPPASGKLQAGKQQTGKQQAGSSRLAAVAGSSSGPGYACTPLCLPACLLASQLTLPPVHLPTTPPCFPRCCPLLAASGTATATSLWQQCGAWPPSCSPASSS